MHQEHKSGIPVLGEVVGRRGLLKLALASGTRTIVAAGPPGQGKSVLAAQLCGAPTFQRAFWVDCGDLGDMQGRLQQLLASRLTNESRKNEGSAYALAKRTEPGEWRAELAVAAESYSNIPICLVLDNHSLIDGIKDVVEVGRLLRPVMHPDSRVILTTRCVDPTILGLLEDAFLMPMEALRFSVVETQQLLAMSGAADTTHETSTEIRTITCGHAALTTLLVRQMVVGCFEVGTSQAPSLDVTVYLLQILDQLGEQDRRLMYACALLGSGSGRELARLFGKPCADGLRRLSAAVPLVRMDCRGDAATFAVHDLAREVYMDLDYRERRIPGWTDIRKGALLALDDRGDYAQLFSELLQESSALEMSEWLERRGRHLMQMGNHGLIHDALEACGTGMMLARPHLLLLSAELLRDRGAYGDALHKARVAKDLAGYSGDDELRYFSCLLVARLQIDMGLVADAVESLGEAITLGECSEADADSMALARAYLSACQVYTGEYVQATANASHALEVVSQMKNPDYRARVVLCAGAADGVRRGLWASVTRTCAQILNGGGLSVGLQLQIVCNHACALLEVGEIERARSIIIDALARSRDYGFEMERSSCYSILSSVYAARGDYAEAGDCADAAVAGFEALGDQLSLVQLLNHRAAWRLATREHELAMADAGRAMETSVLCGCEWLSWASILSASAAMSALGDGGSAVGRLFDNRLIERMRSSEQHALIADVIIAESERLAGNIVGATERLAAHAAYIKTGSANWQLAMNGRAFPHLTGLLALALGVQELPARLLHMVLETDRDSILEAAAEVLPEDELAMLAGRLRVGASSSSGGPCETPRCRVRMFGGLEVTVGSRSVREKSWKKRKARLLFAMLVLQQGKDVPREQLYEYLWPEMDCVRARNNLYVVWSAMKAAMVPGCGKKTPLPYVENVGGLCRAVMPLIDSDIAEFERLRTEVHDAERAQNLESAVAGYHALAEIYRGELLPGDVYDDWFTSARDRYRMEFGDLMLRATNTCQAAEDYDKALRFARKGVTADPWREDLYQATMRLLMHSGQRSAAIETFMTCKHRLAEDLGLDPSSETMTLYGDILAMEDPVEIDSESAGSGESPDRRTIQDAEDAD